MKKNQFKIKSISYVHDPDAAKLWTAEFVESMKREILDCVSKQTDNKHINE